mgnify:CR=1 FL=1
MDWDKLKIFHTVAEASSFTKASTVLNLSQSAIRTFCSSVMLIYYQNFGHFLDNVIIKVDKL